MKIILCSQAAIWLQQEMKKRLGPHYLVKLFKHNIKTKSCQYHQILK